MLQKGLIKLLFATDSFSMGLNMPTKTVVFSSLKKHDGESLRFLHGGEYTQMAGRAGRRGIDTSGKVTSLFYDERHLPEMGQLEDILCRKGEALRSKFKISYNILINSLSSSLVELDEIMKKSFGENTNYHSLKESKGAKVSLEKKLLKNRIDCKFFGDIEDCAKPESSPIEDYNNLVGALQENCHYYFGSNNVAKKLKLPRFGRICDQNLNFHIVLLTGYERDRKKDQIDYYDALLLFRITENVQDHSKQQIKLEKSEKTISKLISVKQNEYIKKWTLQISPAELIEVFTADGKGLAESNEQDLMLDFESVQNLLTKSQLTSQDHAFTDLQLHSTNLALKHYKSEIFSSKNRCWDCSLKPTHLKKLKQNWEFEEKIDSLNKKIKSAEVTFGIDSVERMMKVLTRLEFINDQHIPQIKARIARELGGGEENIFICQILMEGVLNLLEPSEIVACISIYVSQGRASGELGELED